ncbi:tail fiber protein [Paenibacillus aurantius]|uniref:Tail fiber protein n=1 Tax=Paenibacillus aurantius TaxID=2918900 RepID=A0AA96LH53_9BACL|nr:tail fiber protein [Paenibacillus aurantius]WNQ13159.1 tail fiber protein [Paenibacillus aurantius]
MSEAYVGEIRMFAGNFAPVGWELCDGRLLQISENDVLFNLIGTIYGGDGVTTFGLPDLQGRVPVHMGQNPRTGTAYMIGQKAGTETVTLLQGQMPSHSHPVRAQAEAGTLSSPANALWAQSALTPYTTQTSGTADMYNGAVSTAGGNLPHENMMPFLPIRFIIATYGIYPSQT